LDFELLLAATVFREPHPATSAADLDVINLCFLGPNRTSTFPRNEQKLIMKDTKNFLAVAPGPVVTQS
jgi:hypothetical protein